MHGQGIYTYANGDKYTGESKFGKFYGIGEFVYANGTKYIGEFRDDKRNGKGAEYSSNGAVIRQGVWHNDKLEVTFVIGTAPQTQKFHFHWGGPHCAETLNRIAKANTIHGQSSKKAKQEFRHSIELIHELQDSMYVLAHLVPWNTELALDLRHEPVQVLRRIPSSSVLDAIQQLYNGTQYLSRPHQSISWYRFRQMTHQSMYL